MHAAPCAWQHTARPAAGEGLQQRIPDQLVDLHCMHFEHFSDLHAVRHMVALDIFTYSRVY